MLKNYTCKNPCKNDTCDNLSLEKVFLDIEGCTEEQIFRFLCSFCGACSNDVEYGEVSNETLYLLLGLPNKAELVVKLLDTNKTLPINEIILEIKSPIHSNIDFQKAYDNVKNIVKYKKTRDRIMGSIILGAETAGEKLQK